MPAPKKLTGLIIIAGLLAMLYERLTCKE